MIYGSGKWARLIFDKLTSLGLSGLIPKLVGSSNDCDYSRNTLEFSNINSCYVIIASATKEHLSDLKHCLSLQPTAIFVEKGFSNAKEHKKAKKLCKDIPAFILSQYRFSGVFSELKKYEIGNIIKCDYEWEVDRGTPSEWMPHIASLDNYLRKLDRQYYIEDFGTYRIDDVTDFTLRKSNVRSLTLFVETDKFQIKVNLGKTNGFEIVSKVDNSIVEKKIYEDEDCLIQQLESIFVQNDLLKLERLK